MKKSKYSKLSKKRKNCIRKKCKKEQLEISKAIKKYIKKVKKTVKNNTLKKSKNKYRKSKK